MATEMVRAFWDSLKRPLTRQENGRDVLAQVLYDIDKMSIICYTDNLRLQNSPLQIRTEGVPLNG